MELNYSNRLKNCIFCGCKCVEGEKSVTIFSWNSTFFWLITFGQHSDRTLAIFLISWLIPWFFVRGWNNKLRLITGTHQKYICHMCRHFPFTPHLASTMSLKWLKVDSFELDCIDLCTSNEIQFSLKFSSNEKNWWKFCMKIIVGSMHVR